MYSIQQTLKRQPENQGRNCHHVAPNHLRISFARPMLLYVWFADQWLRGSRGKHPSKNYWQFSSTILIQFSCNNRWDFQKCPCNSHLQFSSNSHQTILIQFSPTILIQFSPTILIQFSPDNSHPILTYNSHPILTWQFSSNFHLTILIQFSPDNSHPILTYNSHSILINTAQSILTNNAQPIFS